MILNITSLFLLSALLFASVISFGSAVIVIVPLTSIYASPYLHKLDFNIEVLHLILLSKLYIPRESSIFSTQFFVLNLNG